MTKLNLLAFFFLLTSQTNAQKVYVTSNLEGKYIINTLHPDSAWVDNSFEITNNKVVAYVLLPDKINIYYNENRKSTQFEIQDLGINDNDTLNFIFYKFHSIDTTFYVSGCLNGKHKVSKNTINEYNIGEREIESLPDSIVLETKTKKIVFYKEIVHRIVISHGHGTRKGIPWGYSEDTPCREVIYSNIRKESNYR